MGGAQPQRRRDERLAESLRQVRQGAADRAIGGDPARNDEGAYLGAGGECDAASVDHTVDHRLLKRRGEIGAAVIAARHRARDRTFRSEENTSELQSLMRISYAVFC